MKQLRLSFALVIATGWLVGAGCDDDRGVVDIGAGGVFASGGDATAAGGSIATAGASDAAGAGGARVATGCPADFDAADGQACASEGMLCDEGSSDPCQFGHSLLCENGKWQSQEAFPAPCGGAAGAGGAGHDCAGQTCTGTEACVAYRVVGGALIPPSQNDACPTGRHLEGSRCENDFGYTCAALAGCSSPGTTCRCATGTDCANANTCRLPFAASWLDTSAVLVCELQAP